MAGRVLVSPHRRAWPLLVVVVGLCSPITTTTRGATLVDISYCLGRQQECAARRHIRTPFTRALQLHRPTNSGRVEKSAAIPEGLASGLCHLNLASRYQSEAHRAPSASTNRPSLPSGVYNQRLVSERLLGRTGQTFLGSKQQQRQQQQQQQRQQETPPIGASRMAKSNDCRAATGPRIGCCSGPQSLIDPAPGPLHDASSCSASLTSEAAAAGERAA
jgi:hypothetical protein